jgi:hypothetical protein
VADGLRKCSGHDEHHVTLYTYVTLYISKSRPALAGVVDRAPPPMVTGKSCVEVVFDEEIRFLILEVSLQPDNLNIDLQAYFVCYVIFQCYIEYTQCFQLQ